MKKKSVLFVDDEINILQSLKRLLRKEDYIVKIASSGKEGLALLNDEHINVVVSDNRMQEMSGIEFLQKVKELYPDRIRVILSGYADLDSIYDAINKGEIYRFISKPWKDEELIRTIRKSLLKYDSLKGISNNLKDIKNPNKTPCPCQYKAIGIENKNNNSAPLNLEVYQRIIYSLPIPVLILDKNGSIIQINEAFGQLSDSLDGLKTGMSIYNNLPDEFINAVKEFMDKNIDKYSLTINLFNKSTILYANAIAADINRSNKLYLFSVEVK